MIAVEIQETFSAMKVAFLQDLLYLYLLFLAIMVILAPWIINDS